MAVLTALPKVEIAADSGPEWIQAYKIVENAMRNQWLHMALAPTSIKFSPAVSPDGKTIEFYVRQELGYGYDKPRHESRTVVTHFLIAKNKIVPRELGSSRLSIYLGEIEFPRIHRSRFHIAQLLYYFDVIPEEWSLTSDEWSQLEDYDPAGRGKIALEYSNAGASLIFEHDTYPESGGGATEPIRHRLEVDFDIEATITMHELYDDSGTWRHLAK